MSKERLTIWTAISVVIGCCIGSGVFVKPGRVLLAVGDSKLALLAWLAGGLLSLAGGLTMAEVAARIPREGGVYAYMEELYGRSWGFVCGWVQALIYGPGLMSALSLYFGVLVCQLFGWDSSLNVAVALTGLWVLSTISALSVSGAALIQNFTTIVKLIPIFLIGIAGLAMGHEPIIAPPIPLDVPAAGIGVAILSTLWAYDGWAGVANLAGEIENPSKNLPRAIVLGIATVMFAYLLVNASLFHILPKTEIAALNEKAGARAAEVLFGSWGGLLIGAGIVISVMGSLNGNILAMTRVAYAMALHRAFPFAKTFAFCDPRFGTPVNSIILKTVIATLMVLLLNADRITELAIFSMYLFYAAVFLGLFILRRRDQKENDGFMGYHVPLYPIMPFVACLGSLFICWSMAKISPMDACISIGIALLGFPVFWAMEAFHAKAPSRH